MAVVVEHGHLRAIWDLAVEEVHILKRSMWRLPTAIRCILVLAVLAAFLGILMELLAGIPISVPVSEPHCAEQKAAAGLSEEYPPALVEHLVRA